MASTFQQNRWRNNPTGFRDAIIWTLGVLIFLGIAWLTNGKYSVRGLPYLWKLLNGTDVSETFMPIITLFGWAMVVASSYFQIRVLLIIMRGYNPSTSLQMQAAFLSVYDVVTTGWGLAHDWQPATIYGWAIVLVVTVILTFIFETAISLGWKGV